LGAGAQAIHIPRNKFQHRGIILSVLICSLWRKLSCRAYLIISQVFFLPV
jgi:hypothetical protein